MDLFEAIEKRRSVRRFRSDPVPRTDLERIVDAARLAPSGSNRQMWRFVVLDDAADIGWFSSYERMSWVAQAPALILVTLNPETKWWKEDGSAAIENMMLAATALGYGSCWVEGQILPYEQQIKERFGIPQDWRVLAAIPIGKAVSWPEAKNKKSLSEVMSFGRF